MVIHNMPKTNRFIVITSKGLIDMALAKIISTIATISVAS